MKNPTLSLSIVPSSGVPIYRQLMDQIKRQIAGGQLAPGSFLPTVRRTAADLGVNPMTVSKAYSLLQHDGMVERLRGVGLRVTDTAIVGSEEQRQQQLQPFVEQLVATASQLGLSANEVVRQVRRAFKEYQHARSDSGAK